MSSFRQEFQDLEPVVSSWLDRLISAPREPEPEPSPAEIRAARIAERRQRLARAGYRSARDVPLIASSLDRPPVVQGHRGSHAAATAVFRWIQEPGQIALTLWGPTGTGKSVCAAWAIADEARAVWLHADDAEAEPAVWTQRRERALRASVLVVNDLGDEREWASDRLASLIRRRLDEARRTIVTSNLPVLHQKNIGGAPGVGSIQARYSDRVADRLSSGSVAVVFCGGESLRSRSP